ncbi:MAG TPA: septum site-determining protein MinC [Clostridiaceae bacterium]
MVDDGIIIKGNKDGLNAVINFNKFRDFDDMLENLIKKLQKGKKFYEGSTLKIDTELKFMNGKDLKRLKDILFKEFLIEECILEENDDKSSKVFNGINEGRTKFVRKTIRSGQSINYNGNLVVIGDTNPGSEITATGNIIVLGRIKGKVYAGMGGNDRAIIAAFSLEPQIIQIADIVSRSPEDGNRPQYPEVARIKEGSIVVEPYLLNKYV